MGKNKRQKLSSNPKGKPAKNKAIGKGGKPTGITKPQPQEKKKKHVQQQHTKPTIPFTPVDRILLIGEGDLSFARSLVESHGCKNITATVFESREELEGKYPHVGENIAAVENGAGIVRYGVDATKFGPLWRDVRGKIDRVFFNFPHVGGKSTDVNRQVRYNQELLVAFFKNALTSLAPGGSIIVTLFEGVPYTLWNIRDLARHSGLQVERSFKFQAKAYPGYKHARTLGVVKRKDGKEGGGWRGEERESRSYIFMRKGDVAEVNGGDKRKRGDSSSESEDESSVEDENQSTDWDEDEQEEEEEAEEVDEDDVDGLHENEENEQDEGRDGHD